MTKAEKTALIEELTEKFRESKFFYLTDYTSLNVADTNDFRRKCFEKNVEMKVLKNTLIRKALENISDTQYEGLYDHLKGSTAVLFSEEGKAPAGVIKDYRGVDNEFTALKSAKKYQDIVVGY
ncbi:MAG: 50S ribosomal protein L10 [Bacteroidota bacterium]